MNVSCSMQDFQIGDSGCLELAVSEIAFFSFLARVKQIKKLLKTNFIVSSSVQSTIDLMLHVNSCIVNGKQDMVLCKSIKPHFAIHELNWSSIG